MTLIVCINNFVIFIINEIDQVFHRNIVNSSSKKRFRNSTKPFWNENLKSMWNDVRNAQKRYLATAQNTSARSHALKIFKEKQSTFDKHYSKAKRKYHREKMISIEQLNTQNPRQFWAELNKLGPRKKESIPTEIYDENGQVSDDPIEVLSKWNGEFSELLKGYAKADFDEEHFESVSQGLQNMENSNDVTVELNEPLCLNEIKGALKKAKLNKAVGVDNLCYEIMKNEPSSILLLHLFNRILSCQIIPSIWRRTILKPIPKNASIDPRIPSQYRGIALLSIVYKLFTSVINTKLVKHLENGDMLSEEQNGFRKGRSCVEHIFVLNTVIRNRLADNQSTFVAFLDAEKAFDRIDRTLLLHKLLTNGINGNVYKIIKSIYQETTCCIKINDMLTNWFETESGVLQGDTLSPTLFNVFINDLVSEVNMLNKGIPIGDHNLSILLYADDIVIMSDCEENLQIMLNTIYNWSYRNMIKFNEKKSNVIHFRKQRYDRSSSSFTLGDKTLNIVKEYKYLGIILNEFHDYNVTAKVLSDAANRALGAIINKYLNNNGLGYYTYTRLYNSGVCPILDYGSEVWGYKNFPHIDNIQNKAIRIFLGVHRFAPLAAISGDMGWTHSQTRRHVCMLRLWNRIVNMNQNRLPRIVFEWDKSLNSNTWCSEVKNLLNSCGLIDSYFGNHSVNINAIWASIHEIACLKWSNEVNSKPKLRTYKQIKQAYVVEPYVISFITRSQRSCLSQLRCGILPLFIETGRWSNIVYEQRICKMCSSGQVENEIHFLFYCSFYDNIRRSFLENVLELVPDYNNNITDISKLELCMKRPIVNLFSKFVHNIFNFRQRHMYICPE
jgi:hypothetical protein